MSEKMAVKVGDSVRIRFGGGEVATGKVIEDRGAIGIKAERLYRVRYTLDPEFMHEMDMPASSFEVVRNGAPVE